MRHVGHLLREIFSASRRVYFIFAMVRIDPSLRIGARDRCARFFTPEPAIQS